MVDRNVHEGSAPGPASIRVQRRIEWWDTDASGYYHNTAIARLLETAETLLLARLGILHEVYHRLPRVRLEIDFLRPLAFHDLVDAEFRVGAVGNSSVTYEMDVKREGEVCAQAKAVAVLLDQAGGKPVPWSDEHRRLLLTRGPQAPEVLAGATEAALLKEVQAWFEAQRLRRASDSTDLPG